MKKLIFIALFAVLSITAFNACSNSTPAYSSAGSKSTAKAIYTCTMHPEVRSDKPGKCPKCGMELVKIENADSVRMPSDTVQKH